MASVAVCSIPKPASVDNILDLSPELLLEIFTYLTIKDVCRISKVCKQFRTVAESKRLWGNLWYHLGVRKVQDKIAPILVSKGIRHLDLTVTIKIELLRALMAFPGLHGLRLDFNMAIRMDLVKMLKKVNLTSLKRLVITPVYWQLYGADTIKGLVTMCPNLESLEFFAGDDDVWTNSGAAIFTLKELQVVMVKLKKLKKFVLMGPRFVTFRPVLDLVGCGSATLEHLCMWNCHFDGLTLEAIGRLYPKLRHLEFHMGKYMGKDRAGDCRKFLKHVTVQIFHWCFDLPEEKVAFIERR